MPQDDDIITPKILLQHMQGMQGALTQQMNGLKLGLDKVQDGLGNVENRLGNVEDRLKHVENKVNTLQVGVDNIDKRLDDIELEFLPKRVSALEAAAR